MRAKEILQTIAVLYVVRLIEVGLMLYAAVTLSKRAYDWSTSTYTPPENYNIPFIVGLLFIPKEIYSQYNNHERRLREASLRRRQQAQAITVPFTIGDFVSSMARNNKLIIDILPQKPVQPDQQLELPAAPKQTEAEIDPNLDQTEFMTPSSPPPPLEEDHRQEELPPAVVLQPVVSPPLKTLLKRKRSGCKPFCS